MHRPYTASQGRVGSVCRLFTVKDFSMTHGQTEYTNPSLEKTMQVPNAILAVILAKLLVKSVIAGAITGGVLIAICHKGYADAKKERGV